MTELFSVNGLEACSQTRHGMIFTCCGKVSLVNEVGQSIIRYIMQEDTNSFEVLLKNKSVVSVVWLMFNSKLGSYVYNVDVMGEYKLIQYWHICFGLIAQVILFSP